MGERLLKDYGNVKTGFISQDGKHYKHTQGDFSDAIERVGQLRQTINEQKSRNGYHHIGSVPLPILEDWLNQHNYTMHEFAINAGGEKGKTDINGPGVKDKFLKYFLSRDFSKLHNGHVTTKTHDRGMIYTGGK